jgi:hypothetical protein
MIQGRVFGPRRPLPEEEAEAIPPAPVPARGD